MTKAQIALALFGAVWVEGLALDPRFHPWPSVTIAVIGIVQLVKAGIESGRRHRMALKEIAMRAEVQHAALLRGDMETALFGIYPVQKVNTL